MAFLPNGMIFDCYDEEGSISRGTLYSYGSDLAYVDDPDNDDPTVDPDKDGDFEWGEGHYYYPKPRQGYRILYTALPDTPEGNKRYKWKKFKKDLHGMWQLMPFQIGEIVEKKTG